MTNTTAVEEGGQLLANPYDPSQGFLDEDDEPMPVDPWEEAVSPATPSGFFDIDALRRRNA